MRKTHSTFVELILKGTLLFVIFTVLQNISIFESINRIWMAVMCGALIIQMLAFRYTRKQFLVLMATVALHIIAIAYTDFPLYSVNMLFYFAFWVIFYIFVAKSKEEIANILTNKDGFIDILLWCWTLLVGIAVLVPGSYRNGYFLPYGANGFRLMPTALIIAALAMYMAISRKDNRYNAFLILPAYSAFMGNSRTYFGVFVLFLLMYMYLQTKVKKHFFAAMIPVAGLLLLLMSLTGIANKFETTQYTSTSYFDYWGTITSGRTVFWEWDLIAFFDLPFLQQFVGNGFNFVYEVNGAHMTEIWAHNDFINILMKSGEKWGICVVSV